MGSVDGLDALHEGEGLVELIADMLRSALKWEEGHGEPTRKAAPASENGLTNASCGIDCSQAGDYPPQTILRGGKYDASDDSQRQVRNPPPYL